MKVAVVSTWTGQRPGRERLATALARETDDYVGKFAAEGKCSEPRWYFSNFGVNVWIVEGEFEDLALILTTPEAMRLQAKLALALENMRVEFCTIDRDAQLNASEELFDELKIG
ncbi:MAG TPA: hypothetical protein VFZ64_01245 [Nocardioidaceae bacterium]